MAGRTGAGHAHGKSPDPWMPSVSTGLQGDIPGPLLESVSTAGDRSGLAPSGGIHVPRRLPLTWAPSAKTATLLLSESRLPISVIHLQPCKTSLWSARGFPVSSWTSSTVRQVIQENKTYQLSVLPSCVPHTLAPQLGKPFPEEKSSDVSCPMFLLSQPLSFLSQEDQTQRRASECLALTPSFWIPNNPLKTH